MGLVPPSLRSGSTAAERSPRRDRGERGRSPVAPHPLEHDAVGASPITARGPGREDRQPLSPVRVGGEGGSGRAPSRHAVCGVLPQRSRASEASRGGARPIVPGYLARPDVPCTKYRPCLARTRPSTSSSEPWCGASPSASWRRTRRSGRGTSSSPTGSSSGRASWGSSARTIPEALGGAGGDSWFSVAKSEELARCHMAGVTMGLLVQADMATPVIADLGTPEQKEEFLSPAIRGEKIAALGVSEPNAGSDVAGIETVALRRTATTTSSGARRRSSRTAPARTSSRSWRRRTRRRVPMDAASFSCPRPRRASIVARKLKKIGNHSSDTAELHFDDVRSAEALSPRRGEHGVHVPHAELPERAHHRVHERDRGRRAHD